MIRLWRGFQEVAFFLRQTHGSNVVQMARLWQVIRSLVVCGTPDHVKTVPWAAIAGDPMNPMI